MKHSQLHVPTKREGGSPKAAVGKLKRSARAQATREKILAAAVAVIGRKGYSSATVDEIVEDAGVSKGTAYVHFASKADIARSILEEGLGAIAEDFRAAAEEEPTSREALARMIDSFARRIFEDRNFGQFFVSELWRDGRDWSGEMRGYEERILSTVAEQIARGQREGAIRPEVDPAFTAVAIVGSVLTTSLYYMGPGAPGSGSGGADAGGSGGPPTKLADHADPGDPDANPLAGRFGESIARLTPDEFVARVCSFVSGAYAVQGRGEGGACKAARSE